ncbi:hypothetical protein [Neogemmobacter tilapiae]|uniref:Uncharacterized protein n=1 Tax=Neogemmobacter tilapiae TaxID=875041 RepID=A0A918WQ23_9RHOB|nr:hypothetical protein [Gemmobacter tilapiae]GHC66544.1 hypothetical protein GCM10007315_34180 [Gemmobacter tilapiae]
MEAAEGGRDKQDQQGRDEWGEKNKRKRLKDTFGAGGAGVQESAPPRGAAGQVGGHGLSFQAERR